MATNAGLIFATLIGRPLGAAIFGPIADRIGRTTTTKITITGVASTIIAPIPAVCSRWHGASVLAAASASWRIH